ncbi:hypothetical protein ACJJTC_017419 [Scirpophaga incertulas]
MKDFYLSHKHCFTFQKPLRDSEIEFQLSNLFSSSEDDLDDEVIDSFATSSYNIDLDKRLDEIQVQPVSKPVLRQVASTSQDAIAEVHAGTSHVSLEVPMVHDQNPAETTSLVAAADVQADHYSQYQYWQRLM